MNNGLWQWIHVISYMDQATRGIKILKNNEMELDKQMEIGQSHPLAKLEEILCFGEVRKNMWLLN